MALTKSIAIIIGSSRSPRVGPQVVDFVKSTIESKVNLDDVTISTVDTKEFNLPVYDEPHIPAMVSDPEKFEHEHSRRWAREIARHDGYVLVSPEYNFGVPGSVKNAIDYLYHPWKGKPIAIVTYGVNGGGGSSEQLQHTLSKMGLQVVPTRPQLPFLGGGAGPNAGPAMTTGQLGQSSLDDWKENSSSDVLKAFEELKAAMLVVPTE